VNPIEAVVPARLGTSFRWLLASTVVGNVGDGVALAAGPLLVASQTHDPLLVAAAAFLQRLPWLVLGVFAGAIVDRIDRRRLVIAVDSLRAVVLAALTATIVTGVVDITVVLVVMFVIGTAEVFADIAGSTLLPNMVAREDLGIGNARLMGSYLVTNQLVGPPIGAALFVAGRAWPFGVNALCCLLGAMLVARVAVRPVPDDERARRSVRAEVADGVRWLWRHPPVRTLALTILLFNLTYGAAWSVLVLYATQRLGMSEFGFGLLTTAVAVGGAVGIASYGWLERHFSLGNMMRACLLTETLSHLAFALTRSPYVAMTTMVAFGAEAFVWATTSTTVRQRAVPSALLGRVQSVYMIGLFGGLLVGQAIGGVLARHWGLTAPFWFGFVGSALLLAGIWRPLTSIAHAGDKGRRSTAGPAEA
jgi:MFS family permease